MLKAKRCKRRAEQNEEEEEEDEVGKARINSLK